MNVDYLSRDLSWSQLRLLVFIGLALPSLLFRSFYHKSKWHPLTVSTRLVMRRLGSRRQAQRSEPYGWLALSGYISRDGSSWLGWRWSGGLTICHPMVRGSNPRSAIRSGGHRHPAHYHSWPNGTLYFSTPFQVLRSGLAPPSPALSPLVAMGSSSLHFMREARNKKWKA